MESKSASWAQQFGLTLCPATALDTAIPATVLGVAVIFHTGPAGEKVFLVLESRATPLRQHCHKRLQTATLPPVAELTVAFKIEPVTIPVRPWTQPVANKLFSPVNSGALSALLCAKWFARRAH